MLKVFIDGREGTTGLRIYERLAVRPDIKLLALPEELRKDRAARREMLNSCDIAFLCLPDAAAAEAVRMVENPAVKIIDASTAHRTAAGWAYGFPELSEAQFAAIAASTRVAVPGCHAGGFVALIAPLVATGLLPPDTRLVCCSLTGYSGGGKQMIAAYRDKQRNPLLNAPRLYGLNQSHKHLPEMRVIAGLAQAPLFCPVVGDFYSGMSVSVPLFKEDLAPGAGAAEIKALYRRLYTGPIVNYVEEIGEDGYLSAGVLAGKDSMQVGVVGNSERLLLTARFDNLGKGASGAAIQCLNIMTGRDPAYSLNI